MADDAPDKPGLLSRLFGRSRNPPPGSRSRSRPGASGRDARGFARAVANAADDLVSAPPFATGASPDVPPDEKLPSVLAGADLQPVEPAPAAEARLPSGPSPVAAGGRRAKGLVAAPARRACAGHPRRFPKASPGSSPRESSTRPPSRSSRTRSCRPISGLRHAMRITEAVSARAATTRRSPPTR